LSLYRRLHFGRFAQFLVLDNRQSRADQPCGDGLIPAQFRPDICAAEATLLGAEREAWLFANLQESRASWSVLALQVMMMRWELSALGPLFGLPPGLNIFNVDAVDGYQ
jgi:alkaline phosphatase D